MYKIKMLCYESGSPSWYEDEPVSNPLLEREEAMKSAYEMAVEEAEDWSKESKGESLFRAILDDQRGSVTVEMSDKEGNNPQVMTIYFIQSVEVPRQLEIFGVTCTHTEKSNWNPETKATTIPCLSQEEMYSEAWRMYSREYELARQYGLLKPDESKARRERFLMTITSGGDWVIPRMDELVTFSAWRKIVEF